MVALTDHGSWRSVWRGSWLAAGAAIGLVALAPLPALALAPSELDEEQARLDAALKRAIPEADSFPRRVFTCSEAQRVELASKLRSGAAPRLWTYREARRGGVLLGRVVVGDVIGKTRPITYLVVLAPDNAVRAVEVLEYRESHGGEVQREKWRAQLVGKRAGDPFRLGGDVKNIAGATLSCRALVDAVHDVALLAATACAPEASTERGVSAAKSGEGLARPIEPAAGACVADLGLARTQLCMGTLLSLRADGVQRAAFDAACDAAFARTALLEAAWSAHRADSDVGRLNAAAPGAWCAITEPTARLLERSRVIARASGGAFAAENGALVALWRASASTGREPTADELARARAASGESAIELDAAGLRARRLHPDARLDFGAIGKGAALDEIAREFRARGVTRALFDFGGHLLALDGPAPSTPSGAARGWPVEIRDPRPGATAPLWTLELARASLSTSADDQRGLTISGRAASHVVDARTGRPSERGLAACVLVRESAKPSTDASGTEAGIAERADAWSTAIFASERAPAEAWARDEGLELLLLGSEGEPWTTPGFPARKETP